MSIFGTATTATGTGFSSSGYSSGSFATNIGDLVVVVIGTSVTSDQITSLMDSAGNSYSAGGTFSFDSTISHGWKWYWTVATFASGSNSVSVAFSASQFITEMFVWDVPISGGTPTFDTFATATDSSTSPLNSSNLVTTGTDELILATTYDGSVAAASLVAGTGYTDDGTYGVFGQARSKAEHGIFASPGTTQAYYTFSGSPADYGITAAAFKAMSAPATGSKPFVIIMG